MGVVGVGLDLVEVARVRGLIERHGGRALERVFTGEERAYCDASRRRRFEHYAARFAVKEAALKALGTGRAGSIRWTDVAVARDGGAPSLVVTGEAARIASARGIGAWHVSITHTDTHAAAVVIASAVAPA